MYYYQLKSSIRVYSFTQKWSWNAYLTKRRQLREA